MLGHAQLRGGFGNGAEGVWALRHCDRLVGQRAIDDELLRGDLISEDGRVTAIVVFFDERTVDDVRSEVLAEIDTIARGRLPAGFEAHYNGSLEISEAYNRVTLANQMTFTPPILLITVIAIFFLFRSWRVTLATIVAVLVSVIWTLGLYNLFGFSFNVLSSMIVPLTVVLAIADDVHIVQRFQEERRDGTAEQAFKGTIRHLTAPIFGASITTALGLLSLATSDVVAVRQFGIGAATGVMVDFVISLVLMPTLLAWMRPSRALPPQEQWFKAPLLRVAQFSMTRSWLVIGVAGGATLLAIAGLLQVRVDTNHINFFAQDHPLGQSARIIDEDLAGIYTFQILLEGPAESLRQPDVLQRMDRLEDDLRDLPFVGKVTGVPDYV